MSCQSVATRAFAEPDKDSSMTQCGALQRSVRFSSEARSSMRVSAREYDSECKRETPGSISLTALSVSPSTPHSSMSQSAPSASAAFDLDQPPPPPSCRFPKLEECAHFHYERVSLGGLEVEPVADDEDDAPSSEGWVCLKVRSHVSAPCSEWCSHSDSGWCPERGQAEWTVYRSRENFLALDAMLHRCIYDRKVSGLPNLSEEMPADLAENDTEYRQLISDYVHHFSIIADDSINCGPVLNWLQMDNKGHKLLVANEDSSSINTPAVAAAYSVRKYVSQARDEISFDVGDMISIIDMPGPGESLWWRGKRGFRVGFFPHHCVAVIGDKIPRNMNQPPPIVGSVAVAPIKPVLRKHGKLISLFRSFILSRPSRRALKQQGILKERVFGCDLGEHLLNCGHDVPLVLVECAKAIESRGAVDGIYRLSGGSGLTQRLRAEFDQGGAPDLSAPPVTRDPHAVASLLKMYFRELPNPLCTYQLYERFVSAVQGADEAAKLRAVRETVVKLPPPHYRTLSYLMRHLRRVSLLGALTGMTARNMAIVWAPNLLRAPRPHHALHGLAVQAVVTEFLICYAEDLFAQEQGADSGPDSLELDQQQEVEVQVELRGSDSCRRPKSLPLNPHTKLLSLEEARRRGGKSYAPSSPLPPSSAPVVPPVSTGPQLRPQSDHKPKYIEVGSGPNNLPQYHTVLDLPLPGGKRGIKRSPSGWRGLFSRTKQRATAHAAHAAHSAHAAVTAAPSAAVADTAAAEVSGPLRPVKSCESLNSETDALPPLMASQPHKHHTRSSSCDSYFEPWQTELAEMRLRLSPQERDRHMFSEEDDTVLNRLGVQQESLSSTPLESALCSAEASPRRPLRVDVDAANEFADRRRTALEEQLSSISYIDGESPRGGGGGGGAKPAEKRQCSAREASPGQADIAKRLCKDRDSPRSSLTDAQSSPTFVKMRERNSPRKNKNTARYSGLHHPIGELNQRLTNEVNARIASSMAQRMVEARVERTLESTNDTSRSSNDSIVSNDIDPRIPDVANVGNRVKSFEMNTKSNEHLDKINRDKKDICDGVDKNKMQNGEDTDETIALLQNDIWTDIDEKNDGIVTAKIRRNGENQRLGDKNGTAKSHDNINTTSKVTSDAKSKTGGLTRNFSDVQRLTSEATKNTAEVTKSNELTRVGDSKSRSRLSWHGKDGHTFLKDGHSTLIKIDWPIENSSISNLTTSTLNSSPRTPVTPLYDTLESDSELSENNKQTIKIESNTCDSCSEEKCLKCELQGTDYENLKYLETNLHDSLEKLKSPSTDISYQNLNRLSNISSSNSDQSGRKDDDVLKIMTSSHESSSSYSNTSFKSKNTDDYENYFSRPNYINLQSSSSKSSPGSPLKSPLKSTISITFRSPTKAKDFNRDYEPIDVMNTPTNERDSVYEDIDLEKNLSIVEDASVPDKDASLPTQQACQPTFNQDLIILETPTEQTNIDPDVYSQVKFFKKSIEEVNAMLLESPEKERRTNLTLDLKDKDRHYENVNFGKDYVISDEINVDSLKICDKDIEISHTNEEIDNELKNTDLERDNGNTIKTKANLNVRELAIRFESPTEQKGPFVFEKFKAEIKYPSLERKDDKINTDQTTKIPPPVSPKAFKLSKNSCNARSLDESAFIKEFGNDKTYNDRRKSLEVKDGKTKTKFLPDLNLNLNLEENDKSESDLNKPPSESITPTTENKISLVQRFDVKRPSDLKNLIGFDAEKKLSRERIEKYKEERRNFLREKYSSQSFRSNPDQLTRLKITSKTGDSDNSPKFERRNTVDLGQRMRFSLAKSANNIDTIPSSPLDSPSTREGDRRSTESGLESTIDRDRDTTRAARSREYDSLNRKERASPSLTIRDMTALFEQKSSTTG